ncbi:LarC family nickel insertion protein [Rhizobium changzhiense]|uniref:LarC family nickel insertion protein n=1 Tax=Rhizobium changzhiense TaxID=2692317 RepID=A0ABR6A1L8_9HYPH|nr:LarC family nickel insertion protein [Rhizobium changzhiense]MCH4547351.1 LarC family nickel insertion protein [Rhizobium changzhiense]MCW0019138.1 LarC family nickel insertion protein [Rhizobium sp. BT-226]
MLEIHLDPVGGIAGDMFVAALLDLRPDLNTGLQAALKRCPLIENVECKLVAHHDGVLTGSRFKVHHAEHGADHPHDDNHHHDHHDHQQHEHSHAGDDHGHAEHDRTHAGHHDHVAWRDIRDALNRSALDGETIRHATGVFEKLAEAEAKVHGTTPENVAFHEVGAWDSIADIVSAAWLITQVGAAHWSVGPIPLGGGRVKTAHGLLPVPAPATVHLLKDFDVIDDGIGGERVTPTGAAILAYLCRSKIAPGRRALKGSSHGFGTKRLPGVSNCLRLLAFERREEVSAFNDTVAVLECEIDDQTGEDIAQAVARLRNRPDVRDVVQMPVFGKKGRMMTHLQVLADPSKSRDVAAAILDETTTIGVRAMTAERMTLSREQETVEHAGKIYAFKLVDRPSGRTAKLEADNLTSTPGAAARRSLRRLLEGLLKQKRGDLL